MCGVYLLGATARLTYTGCALDNLGWRGKTVTTATPLRAGCGNGVPYVAWVETPIGNVDLENNSCLGMY